MLQIILVVVTVSALTGEKKQTAIGGWDDMASCFAEAQHFMEAANEVFEDGTYARVSAGCLLRRQDKPA